MREFIKKHEGVFDPETINTLTAALDDAWNSIRASVPSGPHADATRELLAMSILTMAQGGERDQRRLSDGALRDFKEANRRSSGL